MLFQVEEGRGRVAWQRDREVPARRSAHGCVRTWTAPSDILRHDPNRPKNGLNLQQGTLMSAPNALQTLYSSTLAQTPEIGLPSRERHELVANSLVGARSFLRRARDLNSAPHSTPPGRTAGSARVPPRRSDGCGGLGGAAVRPRCGGFLWTNAW